MIDTNKMQHRLNFKIIRQDIKRAIDEDVGAGDITGALIPEDKLVQATICLREPALICGQPWVNETFACIDSTIQISWEVQEGEWIGDAKTICRLQGRARSILTAERTVLNFLQTLSGTATETYKYVQMLEGYKTKLLDTRKTLPGLRYAQKYAVAIAGGTNHRHGLYDAYLIKENHIKACGGINNAIAAAQQTHKDALIEVEVETLEELSLALDASPDRIMLDNFSMEQLAKAVEMCAGFSSTLEASGGVSLDTLQAIATTGVDYISVGAITKSVKAVDLSLLLVE
jgi:nicotinate-nucleotide pyrophosphorylase (carboxylating)